MMTNLPKSGWPDARWSYMHEGVPMVIIARYTICDALGKLSERRKAYDMMTDWLWEHRKERGGTLVNDVDYYGQ